MRIKRELLNRTCATVFVLMLVLLAGALLVSCGKKAQEGSAYKVFFPDAEYASILSEERTAVSANSSGDNVTVMLSMLMEEPSDEAGVASISGDIIPRNVSYDGQRVVLDFPSAYLDMDKTREILVRASVVETLTQDEDVRSVAFTVDGAELMDGEGAPVGDMTADSFINNTGAELNSYARANVTLYFTDINGNALKRYDENVVYNTNISMEKFVTETLIGGPLGVNEQNAYPTLSPETKLLSVIIKDRIAYANFDASVREEPYNVREDVALYSIVNTLTALPGIDQVQISIEGSTEGVFMDKFPLDELYERNEELIE